MGDGPITEMNVIRITYTNVLKMERLATLVLVTVAGGEALGEVEL